MTFLYINFTIVHFNSEAPEENIILGNSYSTWVKLVIRTVEKIKQFVRDSGDTH